MPTTILHLEKYAHDHDRIIIWQLTKNHVIIRYTKNNNTVVTSYHTSIARWNTATITVDFLFIIITTTNAHGYPTSTPKCERCWVIVSHSCTAITRPKCMVPTTLQNLFSWLFPDFQGQNESFSSTNLFTWNTNVDFQSLAITLKTRQCSYKHGVCPMHFDSLQYMSI